MLRRVRPWAFFVTFNLSWIVVWAAAAFSIRTSARWAFVPMWFLAIAMMLNGIATTGHGLTSALH